VAGRAHHVIVSTAKKTKASMIIMGTHGVSGFREFFIGSNTFRVVHDAGCPVLSISRAMKKPGFSNILVPFRDKPHSREKVDYAISIGQKYGASVHVLAVDTEDSKSKKKKLQLEADQIVRFVEEAGLKGTAKVTGGLYHAEEIIRFAKKKKCDLIISMADMDRMDVTEFIKGPYAQQIVNHSPIPVLSVSPTFNPDTVNMSTFL
jgi:nucleotide-binding universal stress UspA family protein